MGAELCSEAEDHGYHPDLCSYARIDLGHAFSGKTPAGKLPRPDVLFCSNNICQTVMYWYKELAHIWKIPLILFDSQYWAGLYEWVRTTMLGRGNISEADLSFVQVTDSPAEAVRILIEHYERSCAEYGDPLSGTVRGGLRGEARTRLGMRAGGKTPRPRPAVCPKDCRLPLVEH